MNLKSSDAKEIAINQGMKIKKEIENEKKKQTRRSSNSSGYAFETEEKIKNLVEMIAKLYISLFEYDKGIQYFKANYREINQEIAYFALFDILQEYDLKKLWISEYEAAEKAGAYLRESLVREYKSLIATSDWVQF